MQTLQQQRAGFALAQVKAVPAADREDFKRQAESFPAMIRMNGLGQAAAFYLSKREKPKDKAERKINAHERLYLLLSEWLTRSGQPYHGQKNLLDGITKQDMHAYRLAQAEALLLLDWVKRFAKAFAEEDVQADNAPEVQP
jgi:CRISPR-associated protein Cmr5